MRKIKKLLDFGFFVSYFCVAIKNCKAHICIIQKNTIVMSKKEMNKEFEYKGFKFNMKVEDKTFVEKNQVYERYTITTNCMGYDNYYSKVNHNGSLTAYDINEQERFAREYVDKKLDKVNNKTGFERDLCEWGFK